jgi:DNA-binding MarR family transcriptional regulator
MSLKEVVKPAEEKTRPRPGTKDLTFTQLRILLSIQYGKDQVGKLAQNSRVTQPAMSNIVDHLIDLKLVRRYPHPTDRRQIKLCLTPKGIALTERVRRKAAERYVGAIQHLSVGDRKAMIDGIKVIFDVIEATAMAEQGRR